MSPTPPDRQPAATEQIEARYGNLDSWSTAEMLDAMLEAQLEAVAAVRAALPAIAAAVEDAAAALRCGGRLVYAGAGTSGRIGVQDGAELTPTFDWPRERLVFLMAGGEQALIRSVEGAEDSETDGTRVAAETKIGPNDVVIGVAASGATPYTIGVMRAAQAAGAITIAVSSNADAPLFEAAHHRILVKTGGEVIAGSTRMKAGTAQKIVLNLFSTALMVKLGRVYRGLMVHMRATNAKLRKRAVRIVQELAGCDEAAAMQHLETADGDLKLAVLLAGGAERRQAMAALAKHDGNLRFAIAELKPNHD
jgi:N-acetylmuramic acid 6-phosphate etherase